MTQIELDILKERMLKEFYDKVGITPTRQALDASHEAFSNNLVEKFFEIVSAQNQAN